MNESVSVAVVVPAVAPVTLEMVSPVIVVSSSNRLSPEPAYVAFAKFTASEALFRVDSVSVLGVDEIWTASATTTAILKVSVSWSAEPVVESASDAVMVILLEPTVVGVPQISRASVPGQEPLPSSSNIRPTGRPEAV